MRCCLGNTSVVLISADALLITLSVKDVPIYVRHQPTQAVDHPAWQSGLNRRAPNWVPSTVGNARARRLEQSLIDGARPPSAALSHRPGGNISGYSQRNAPISATDHKIGRSQRCRSTERPEREARSSANHRKVISFGHKPLHAFMPWVILLPLFGAQSGAERLRSCCGRPQYVRA